MNEIIIKEIYVYIYSPVHQISRSSNILSRLESGKQNAESFFLKLKNPSILTQQAPKSAYRYSDRWSWKKKAGLIVMKAFFPLSGCPFGTSAHLGTTRNVHMAYCVHSHVIIA